MGETIIFGFAVDHVGGYGDIVTNRTRYSHASGSGSDTATFAVQDGAILYLPLVIKTMVP